MDKCICGHTRGRHFYEPDTSCRVNRCNCEKYELNAQEHLDATDPCICGHWKGEHVFFHYNKPIIKNRFCFAKKQNNWHYCNCNDFKLDNLTLIEKLAKEKNLI